MPLTQSMKAGLAYFALAFGAGFLLGMIRVPFLVPRLDERVAELIEMPFMFVVVVLAARFIVRRLAVPAHAAPRLAVGVIGLACLIAAEILLTVAMQDLSLAEYVASRDPVSGAVYLLMLVLFAVMPLLLVRFGKRS